MKGYNIELYKKAEGLTPVSVQEENGQKIEIFFLNDFPEYLAQIESKGTFAFWSTLDNKTFRFFIEKGYYHTLPELYENSSYNAIWMAFFKEREKVWKKCQYTIFTPIMVVLLALFVVFSAIPSIKNQKWSTYVQIIIIVCLFLSLILYSKFTQRKFRMMEIKAQEDVKNLVGGETEYNDIVKRSDVYKSKYLHDLQQQRENEYNALNNQDSCVNNDTQDEIESTINTDEEIKEVEVVDSQTNIENNTEEESKEETTNTNKEENNN